MGIEVEVQPRRLRAEVADDLVDVIVIGDVNDGVLVVGSNVRKGAPFGGGAARTRHKRQVEHEPRRTVAEVAGDLDDVVLRAPVDQRIRVVAADVADDVWNRISSSGRRRRQRCVDRGIEEVIVDEIVLPEVGVSSWMRWLFAT